MRKGKSFGIMLLLFVGIGIAGCSDNAAGPDTDTEATRSSSVSYAELTEFSASESSTEGAVYEVLPGPAAVNPAMDPTPFSNNTAETTGSYSLTVADRNAEDSQDSEDAVTSVDIRFTGNDGQAYKIDQIDVIHKPAGAGDHTFFGGVGFNKVMHGNTGIGNSLMPKMLSYITLWGLADLKDANTDTVIASDRLVHIMTGTNVRDENRQLITAVDKDKSDHNIRNIQTHIMLPPKDTNDNQDPVPGTAHGFLHLMFEKVELSNANRNWKTAYEILPGPAVINPDMNPTPFSNRIEPGAGTYSLAVEDVAENDAEDSGDRVSNFALRYQRPNGTTFVIDSIRVIHKPEGAGDHTFFGGVGVDKTMHGNTGIGNPLMPKLFSHITLWGLADLKDGDGNILAEDRLIHIMVSSRVRTDDLKLITATGSDQSDQAQTETHIMLPPQDTTGNADPVPGTGHGFLHLMFENVDLSIIG
ncbi:MAG: hypothetical protein K9N46_09215 [Candidatus Marinimicrobia bacterium]|nr:hypothetical protein [Candidatus Neomarinimicrobiota bacterium]MCF7829418.1 hypothetical protein [Candidatus Neomarinimicrobiota bacterium]MCF7880904.1 hypothetical protein [Candidatus Neomarinimicrobiota bacterium]